MAVEFLLLNGAKINSQDTDGKTPLHLATKLGKSDLLCGNHLGIKSNKN